MSAPPPPKRPAFGTRTEIRPGGVSQSYFPVAALEWALRRFGEDELLARVRGGIDDETITAIGVHHACLITGPDPDLRSGVGPADDRALALAAVEVMEGRARRLARAKRRADPSP